MNTQNNILTLLIASMEQAIEYKRRLYPDIQIQEQFDNVFDEFQFVIGTFFFELEADYEIPEDLDDYSLTFREFAAKVAEHPKEPYDYRKHWQN